MRDFGLAEPGSFVIDRPAPRTEALRTYGGYTERFIKITASDSGRSLGRAEVAEAYVHDFQYRCDIDLTGLKLSLTLSERAFEQYRQFIGSVPTFASSKYDGGWRGDLVISIPSPDFAFPAPRGSDVPYPPHGATVRKLRTIRRFKFDRIDVLKLFQGADGVLQDFDLGRVESENVLRMMRQR